MAINNWHGHQQLNIMGELIKIHQLESSFQSADMIVYQKARVIVEVDKPLARLILL